jgi:hypothetical protein
VHRGTIDDFHVDGNTSAHAFGHRAEVFEEMLAPIQSRRIVFEELRHDFDIDSADPEMPLLVADDVRHDIDGHSDGFESDFSQTKRETGSQAIAHGGRQYGSRIRARAFAEWRQFVEDKGPERLTILEGRHEFITAHQVQLDMMFA